NQPSNSVNDARRPARNCASKYTTTSAPPIAATTDQAGIRTCGREGSCRPRRTPAATATTPTRAPATSTVATENGIETIQIQTSTVAVEETPSMYARPLSRSSSPHERQPRSAKSTATPTARNHALSATTPQIAPQLIAPPR